MVKGTQMLGKRGAGPSPKTQMHLTWRRYMRKGTHPQASLLPPVKEGGRGVFRIPPFLSEAEGETMMPCSSGLSTLAGKQDLYFVRDWNEKGRQRRY